LLLADLLTNQPMQISSQLILYRGGLLRITNSTLRLPSGVAQLNNYGGNISLENGLLDFDLANLMRLGRYSTNQASLTVKGGTMFGSQLQIGQDKALGTLTLSNGVINLSSFLSLGTSSTGNPIAGGTGVVTVVNGQLLVTNGVTEVGYQGIGQMNVSGGTTKLANLSVGNVQGAAGTVSISGGQFYVLPRTTNDPTRLGNSGSGTLNITGGSVALMNELILGDYPGGPLARGTGMVMIAGGSLVATNDLTSIGKFGVGFMTISNSTVTLANVSVGRHDGSTGTLNLQTSGVLNCLDALSIGRLELSTGHLFVTGGLLSLTNNTLWVGRGGNGDMTLSGGTARASSLFVAVSMFETNNLGATVTNQPAGTFTMTGGALELTSRFLIGTESYSTGHVAISGGNLSVTNGGGGNLSVGQGTLQLNGGTLVTDSVTLTNSTGQFVFGKGTLQTKSMTVSNGAPFIVGDGVNVATLQLDGGTYSFANGLVISSNSTVTGCGTIVGNVTNNGTFSTNCGPVINITGINYAGMTATVSFSSLSGLNHLLQFKTDLAVPTWKTISPGVIGDGGIRFLSDTTATNASRLYRILAQ
ncbi:MAG: hypothetical protein ABIQ35_12220, partial [Verrucomicrobiota bacterium]